MHECRYGDALIIYIYNMHNAGIHWYQMHSKLTLIEVITMSKQDTRGDKQATQHV
jgi:hypothetical protein